MSEELLVGAMIHRNAPNGEDECYNLAVFTEEVLLEWIPIFDTWFPGDYLMDLRDCIVDDDQAPYFTQINMGWLRRSNGKWYLPNWTPPEDLVDTE